MKAPRIFSLAIPLVLALVAPCPAFAADDEDTKQDDDAEYGDEWVWLDAEAGYQAVDMVSFSADETLISAGLLPTGVAGPAVGLGAGIRLWFVTIGPRLRLGMLDGDLPREDDFEMWSLDAEVGIRVPLGRLEPHFIVAAGYTGLGGVDDVAAQIEDTYEIRGANVRGGAGLDVFITPLFSVGADVSGEVLVLSRPGVPLNQLLEAREVGTLSEAEARILEADGASTGGALTVTGGLGLHF